MKSTGNILEKYWKSTFPFLRKILCQVKVKVGVLFLKYISQVTK